MQVFNPEVIFNFNWMRMHVWVRTLHVFWVHECGYTAKQSSVDSEMQLNDRIDNIHVCSKTNVQSKKQARWQELWNLQDLGMNVHFYMYKHGKQPLFAANVQREQELTDAHAATGTESK